MSNTSGTIMASQAPGADTRWVRTGPASARTRALGIISTLVLVLVLLLASAVQATSRGEDQTTVDYRVRSGDTLWVIAEEHGPQSGDVRDVIAVIQDLNDLETALIYPGQVLQIPVATSD